MYFSFSLLYYSNYHEYVEMPEGTSICTHVPYHFIVDYENEVFIDEHGVVKNAYDFSSLSEEEITKEVSKILLNELRYHPEYELKLISGKFPVDVTDAKKTPEGRYFSDEPIMSTHILYITNYKELIDKNKKLIKDRKI